MKDIAHQKLDLGDTVAFNIPNYRGLTLGRVIAFTPLKVRVEFKNNWNFPTNPMIETYLVGPKDLVKVEKNLIQDEKFCLP
jgi:hypothetical protein